MRIYVVRPGDSLWTIARRFGVTPSSITKANGIESSARLVVGQTLVVRVEEKLKNYGNIQVNAFIQPSNEEKERVVLKDSIKYLTYITPFSHHVKEDGSLTPLKDSVILEEAASNKVATMLSVTNISGVVGANFNTDLINNILNSNSKQETLINNMLTIVKRKGYKGVIVDFEKIFPTFREKYNDFLRKVVAKFHPKYLVATALAPKTYDVKVGAWHGAHDYKSQGEIVDFVIIMTYEWGWSGGPPMAVAPINEVRKVINYAVSVIPPKKIMMGMPLYGYDWTLPYTPGGEFAESIGNEEAVTRAARFRTIIRYDEKSKSPYYNYIDKDGKSHVVWFEDARSVDAKYKLVSEFNLRGVSYWALGKPFLQNFQVLDNMFNIEKV